MTKSQKLRTKLMAFAFMFLGSSLVFAAVLMMNKVSKPPEKTDSVSAVNFNVKKTPPPEKKETIKKPRRKPRKMKRHRRTIAPPPDLGLNISGIRIAAPEFEQPDMDLVSDSILGDINNVVMTEDAVDNRPVPTSRTSVEYPPRARAKNITGYVVLNMLIGSDGRVKSVKVLESNPGGVFEQNAVASARGWTFRPATYKNKNVEVWAKQTIRFKLN